MKPNEVMEGVKFGESRLKCAQSKNLKNCRDCKEDLMAIWNCKEWLKHDSIFTRFKRRLAI